MHFSSSSGDGPERAGVEALATELGVREHSRFLGYRRDMGHWYGMFDAFLLTSENEGTPVVAIEALASECPVVATDAGGTATVVRHGESGFLAPVGDTHALAAHLHDARLPTRPRALARAGRGRTTWRSDSPRRPWRTPSMRSTGGCSTPREGSAHPQDHRDQRFRAAPPVAPAGAA